MQLPYRRPSQSVLACGLYPPPTNRNIEFVKGDQFDDGPFTFPGRVWTPSRPLDADDLPMYHEDETVPEDVEEVSPTALVAPWEQRFWFAEIRSSYLSTVRYYNGWVPWYGTRPNRVWWSQMSLGAWFTVTATYDTELGTVVVATLPSGQSTKLNPGGRYRWDMESAKPDEFDSEGLPTHFIGTKTWLRGSVSVMADWTQRPPVRVIGATDGQGHGRY